MAMTCYEENTVGFWKERSIGREVESDNGKIIRLDKRIPFGRETYFH